MNKLLFESDTKDLTQYFEISADGKTFIKFSQSAYIESKEPIILPEGITTISRQAFYNCRISAPAIVFPSTVTKIAAQAFFQSKLYSTALKFLSESSIESIDERAFSHCSTDANQTFKFDALTNIEKGLFLAADMPNITLDFSNTNARVLPAECFDGIFKSVILPEGIEVVGPNCLPKLGKVLNFNSARLKMLDASNLKKLFVTDKLKLNRFTKLTFDGKPYSVDNPSFSIYDDEGLGGTYSYIEIPGNMINIFDNFFRYISPEQGATIKFSAGVKGIELNKCLDKNCNIYIPKTVHTLSINQRHMKFEGFIKCPDNPDLYEFLTTYVPEDCIVRY